MGGEHPISAWRRTARRESRRRRNMAARCFLRVRAREHRAAADEGPGTRPKHGSHASLHERLDQLLFARCLQRRSDDTRERVDDHRRRPGCQIHAGPWTAAEHAVPPRGGEPRRRAREPRAADRRAARTDDFNGAQDPRGDRVIAPRLRRDSARRTHEPRARERSARGESHRDLRRHRAAARVPRALRHDLVRRGAPHPGARRSHGARRHGIACCGSSSARR